MLISKVITNDNLGVKKYCINEKKVLGKILYILSQLLRILGIKKNNWYLEILYPWGL